MRGPRRPWRPMAKLSYSGDETANDSSGRFPRSSLLVVKQLRAYDKHVEVLISSGDVDKC